MQCASEYRFEAALLEGLKDKIRRVDVPPSVIEKVESVLKGYRRENATEGNDGGAG